MTQNSKWYGKWLDVQAERDRLAARVREMEAALWEMLSHYAPDPDDDTEAAVSAYAVLGEQAGSEGG